MPGSFLFKTSYVMCRIFGVFPLPVSSNRDFDCVKILDFGNVYFSDNVCSDLYVYILLNW